MLIIKNKIYCFNFVRDTETLPGIGQPLIVREVGGERSMYRFMTI